MHLKLYHIIGKIIIPAGSLPYAHHYFLFSFLCSPLFLPLALRLPPAAIILALAVPWTHCCFYVLHTALRFCYFTTYFVLCLSSNSPLPL
ncbi:hypothetical protein BX661DRAFT_190240 [Kickxella alabastrina]|uniref:uncharacterized protein n=1 Tax=Kickxella alabastrina TaxID=61397 RepID=UPI002220EA1B|nr:uncharacterized protein BX661DRAFT_190240 [Kickxella alabastrina]KAI7819555.1 hypothetical protein BX661DRAFT_190240 [Kickxella alabastrina]